MNSYTDVDRFRRVPYAEAFALDSGSYDDDGNRIEDDEDDGYLDQEVVLVVPLDALFEPGGTSRLVLVSSEGMVRLSLRLLRTRRADMGLSRYLVPLPMKPVFSHY